MAYKKPQDPLTNNGFGIYPLTTADQVILSDGSRLEKNKQITANNSEKLGNVAASEYALKNDTVLNSEKLSGKSLAEIMLALYPVGAVYISVNSTSPASLFGGTWIQIEDTFLLASGSNYTAGNTGGNATHYHETAAVALTIAQMPYHGHGVGIKQTSGNYVPYNNTALLSFRNQSEIYTPAINGVLTDMAPDLYTYNNFIESTGSGAAHSHGNTTSASSLPPYLAVYMWRRVS